MKVLLRSTILVQHTDVPDLFYKNEQLLYKSGLGFEVKEDQTIWEFVKDFAASESHVPNFNTLRDHFAQQNEVQILDRLQVISGITPITRGDFHLRLEDKAKERQIRRVEQLIVDASEIVRRGKEIHNGKKVTKVKGPVAALRHIVEQSHEIIAPSLGLKLSGEATSDGGDLWEEYQKVKNDPRAGLGQFTGLAGMDKLKGAKRKQLWTHAAFTGQLKSILALNWAYNQAVYYYYSSMYMSLEMPYDQCRRMLYAMHSIHGKFRDIRIKMGIQQHPSISVGCPYEWIRDGTLTDMQEEFLHEYVIPDFGDKDTNPYGQIHIHTADFDKSTFTVDDLRMKTEMQYSQDPIESVFIDHAGLMTAREKYGTTTERLNEVMRDLKRFALNFNQGLGMATVALFQLSREGLKRLLKAREKGNEPLYNLTDLSYANECCFKNTYLATTRGVLPIEKIQVGDHVWSSSGWKEVFSKFDQGVQEIYETVTDRGMRLETTGNHLVRVLEKGKIAWKVISALRKGDWVLGQKNVAVFPETYPELPPLEVCGQENVVGRQGVSLETPGYMTDELAYLMGIWAGDGCMTPRGIAITGNRKEQTLTFMRSKDPGREGTSWAYSLCLKVRVNRSIILCSSQPFKRWFEGVCGFRGSVVPEVVFRSPRSAINSYIRGLFDTAGGINSQNMLFLTSKNRHFLESVQFLMMLLGYDTKIHTRNTKSKQTNKKYLRSDLFVKTVDSRRRFAEDIGFTEPHKQQRLADSIGHGRKRKSSQEYPVAQMLLSLCEDYIPHRVATNMFRGGIHHAIKQIREKDTVPEGVLRHLCDVLTEQGVVDPRITFFQKLTDQYLVMKVESVRKTGVLGQMYDLEVGGDHEYLTGPLLSHNCERSSDVVSTGYIDKELREQNLLQIQCLKARDDEPFETFRAKVLFPYRRIINWNEIASMHPDDGEDEDFSDLLDEM